MKHAPALWCAHDCPLNVIYMQETRNCRTRHEGSQGMRVVKQRARPAVVELGLPCVALQDCVRVPCQAVSVSFRAGDSLAARGKQQWIASLAIVWGKGMTRADGRQQDRRTGGQGDMLFADCIQMRARHIPPPLLKLLQQLLILRLELEQLLNLIRPCLRELLRELLLRKTRVRHGSRAYAFSLGCQLRPKHT